MLRLPGWQNRGYMAQKNLPEIFYHYTHSNSLCLGHEIIPIFLMRNTRGRKEAEERLRVAESPGSGGVKQQALAAGCLVRCSEPGWPRWGVPSLCTPAPVGEYTQINRQLRLLRLPAGGDCLHTFPTTASKSEIKEQQWQVFVNCIWNWPRTGGS